MRRLPAVALLCALSAAAAGCASARTDFYTLSLAAEPGAASPGCSVAVGPVTVPAVVDRPQIVVRTGPNRVAIDEFNRWGSPLRADIARVVAGDLSTILSTPFVTVFPQQTAVAPTCRVAVDVLSFDSAPGEAAALDAVWTVRNASGDASSAGRTTVREPVADAGYAALVAAHSRALGKLSRDLAGAIRALPCAAR